ncbi:hypothetical protein Tco_0385256 [Tanacetum coccineum]
MAVRRMPYEQFAEYLEEKSGNYFQGQQVTQNDDGIFISQDKYVDEILKKFGFLTVKTTSTPIETSNPLMKDENAEDCGKLEGGLNSLLLFNLRKYSSLALEDLSLDYLETKLYD